MNHKVMEGLERRKDASESPCGQCDGTGRSKLSEPERPMVCGKCLGQRIDLTRAEYAMLMEFAFAEKEEVMDLGEIS